MLLHSMEVELRFLDEARTGPGPVVHVAVPELALRSTNKQGDVVPLTEAHAQGTAGNMLTLWKKADIGCVTVVFEHGDFRRAMCLLQPTSAMVAVRRRVGAKLPAEVHVSLRVPLVTLSLDKRSWATTAEILSAAVWCLREKDATKRRAPDGSTITAASTLVDTSSSRNSSNSSDSDSVDDGAVAAAVDAVAESEAAGAGDDSAAALLIEKLPVVHLDTHVEKVVIALPGIAELRVDECALSVVFDHSENSSGGRGAGEGVQKQEHGEQEEGKTGTTTAATLGELERKSNKELMVQISVISVACTSLVPQQGRTAVVHMNEEEQFLSAAFTVRPFLLFRAPGAGDPAAVEGKVRLGDTTLTMTFELFREFYALATSFVPNRPPQPLRPEHVHSALWWLDNSAVTLQTRGLRLNVVNTKSGVPVTLYAALRSGTASTTRVTSLLRAYLSPLTDPHAVKDEQLDVVASPPPSPQSQRPSSQPGSARPSSEVMCDRDDSTQEASVTGTEETTRTKEEGFRLLRGDAVLNGVCVGVSVGDAVVNIVEPAQMTAHADWFRPLAFLEALLFPRDEDDSEGEGEDDDGLGRTPRGTMPALCLCASLPALGLALNQARLVEAHRLLSEFAAWGKQNAFEIIAFATATLRSLVRSLEDRRAHGRAPARRPRHFFLRRRLVRLYAEAHADHGTLTGSCSRSTLAAGVAALQSFVPSASLYDTAARAAREAARLLFTVFDAADVLDFLRLSVRALHVSCLYSPDARALAMKQTAHFAMTDFTGDVTLGTAFPFTATLRTMPIPLPSSSSSSSSSSSFLGNSEGDKSDGDKSSSKGNSSTETLLGLLRSSPLREHNMLDVRLSFYAGKYMMLLQPCVRTVVSGLHMQVQSDMPSVLRVVDSVRRNWQHALTPAPHAPEGSGAAAAVPDAIRELRSAVVHAATEAGYSLLENEQLKSLFGVLLALELSNVAVALTEHPDAQTPGTRPPAVYFQLTPQAMAAELRFAQCCLQDRLQRAEGELLARTDHATAAERRVRDEADAAQLALVFTQRARALAAQRLAQRRADVHRLEQTLAFLHATLAKVEAQNAQLVQALRNSSGSSSSGSNDAQPTSSGSGDAEATAIATTTTTTTTGDTAAEAAAVLGGEAGQMIAVNSSLAAQAEATLVANTRRACEAGEYARLAAAHAAEFALQMEMCRTRREHVVGGLRAELERLRERAAQQRAELAAREQLAQHERVLRTQLHDMHLREAQLEAQLCRAPGQEGEEEALPAPVCVIAEHVHEDYVADRDAHAHNTVLGHM